MSGTPRTDGLTILAQLGMIPACNIVPAVFASKLQRELAEVTKQRDALLEGLEKLASCDWVITLPDRMEAVREIATETLNKIKP